MDYDDYEDDEVENIMHDCDEDEESNECCCRHPCVNCMDCLDLSNRDFR
jgi:hypothetical protein